MKVKVKFDVATIKRSLIDHGEKLAFGAVVLVFLMFTWAAAKREVLDASKQPDVLKQKASEVEGHVRQSTFNADREKVILVDYDKRAQRQEILAESYALTRPFDPLTADQKTKRDDPTAFPVEEPQAAGGYGAFALKGEGADADKRAGGAGGRGGAASRSGGGYRPTPEAKFEVRAFVVVTALIPVQKQAKEYSRAFENADGADRQRDAPFYAGYVLERAEIDDKHPEKLEWKEVDNSDSFVKRWETRLVDVVGKEFIEPWLTMPLGPLVGVDWNESVSHPKIPLADADDRPQTAVAPEPPKGDDAAAADKADDHFHRRAREDVKKAPPVAAPRRRKRLRPAAAIAYCGSLTLQSHPSRSTGIGSE